MAPPADAAGTRLAAVAPAVWGARWRSLLRRLRFLPEPGSQPAALHPCRLRSPSALGQIRLRQPAHAAAAARLCACLWERVLLSDGFQQGSSCPVDTACTAELSGGPPTAAAGLHAAGLWRPPRGSSAPSAVQVSESSAGTIQIDGRLLL